jgi:hypothetical protein
MISSLYNKYFQKSKVFLYPLIELPKTNLISSFQTYIAWENIIRQEDYKLICVFTDVDKEEFIKYEDKYIITSKYYLDKHLGLNNECVYIFDLSAFSKDWNNFLKGKYSLFSEKASLLIQKHYGIKSNEYEYIKTFLEPSKYIKLYSQLLEIDEEIIKSIGELCDPYDINKEFLKFSLINSEKPNVFA